MARIPRRRFFQALAGASGLGLAAGGYTWLWEPHWVEVVSRPLPVANLPERLVGARLVQLSDLHIGPRVSDAYLLQTFDQVRALEPDVVVFTGDLTSYHEDVLNHAGRMLARAPRGRRATLGILGNHDYGLRWAQPEVADGIVAAAAEGGIRLLRNEVVEVDGLQVAGLDDLWSRRFVPERALSRLDPGVAALVLSHNPDTVDEPGWGGYQGWVLAGHTHGGQCKPPFLPAPLLPVKNRRYRAGEVAVSGGRKLYINRGLGHLLKVRFNVRPEITLFHLARAA